MENPRRINLADIGYIAIRAFNRIPASFWFITAFLSLSATAIRSGLPEYLTDMILGNKVSLNIVSEVSCAYEMHDSHPLSNHIDLLIDASGFSQLYQAEGHYLEVTDITSKRSVISSVDPNPDGFSKRIHGGIPSNTGEGRLDFHSGDSLEIRIRPEGRDENWGVPVRALGFNIEVPYCDFSDPFFQEDINQENLLTAKS